VTIPSTNQAPVANDAGVFNVHQGQAI
jgi:hypothetical protein